MNSAVSKATRPDGNYPKEKHVIALCTLSWETKNACKGMLDLLASKMFEGTAETILKSLIVIHCLMRDGCSENIFGYLSQNPRIIDISRVKPKSLGYIKLRTIEAYSNYLRHKVLVYQKKRVDFAEARPGPGLRLMTEGIESGLLDNVNILQDHLEIILETEYKNSEFEDHVSVYLFKILIRDLLKIFQCINQGVISILKSYFDLNEEMAGKCLSIYKRFIKQTERVIRFLAIAREAEMVLQINVPDLKHAPTFLLESLESHLNSLSGPVSVPQKAPVATAKAPITEKSVSAKKDAMDFFASLDDDLAMQNYQPPVSHISLSVNDSLSPPTGNPFMSNQRACSPFDSIQRSRSPFETNQRARSPFEPLTPSFNQTQQPGFHSEFSSGQMNPFSQTQPSFLVSESPNNTNPFTSFPSQRHVSQQPQQFQQSFPAQRQLSQPNRTTMNPFEMDTFNFTGTTPLQNSNFNTTSANQVNNPPPSNTPFSFPQSKPNPHQPSNDFANFFNQHSFPTQ